MGGGLWEWGEWARPSWNVAPTSQLRATTAHWGVRRKARGLCPGDELISPVLGYLMALKCLINYKLLSTVCCGRCGWGEFRLHPAVHCF